MKNNLTPKLANIIIAMTSQTYCLCMKTYSYFYSDFLVTLVVVSLHYFCCCIDIAVESCPVLVHSINSLIENTKVQFFSSGHHGWGSKWLTWGWTDTLKILPKWETSGCSLMTASWVTGLYSTSWARTWTVHSSWTSSLSSAPNIMSGIW